MDILYHYCYTKNMTEKTTFPPDATQRFVEIKQILNETIVLKNGALRAVLMVSGINFELKSEEEQNMIIGAYQNFLNSLDFSLQIVVHSRKINIDAYISKIEKIKDKENNTLLRNQIDEYSKFIEEFVKENNIMSKNFFAVIPYQPGGVKEIKSGIMSMIPFLNNKKNKNSYSSDETLEQQIIQLKRRADQVVSGLGRIGLRTVRLNKEELMELYYNLYNPGNVEKKFAGQDKN